MRGGGKEEREEASAPSRHLSGYESDSVSLLTVSSSSSFFSGPLLLLLCVGNSKTKSHANLGTKMAVEKYSLPPLPYELNV